MTPLHYAAYSNQTEAVKTLLAVGHPNNATRNDRVIKVNIQNNEGVLKYKSYLTNLQVSPLQYAVTNKNREMVMALLRANSDTMLVDNTGSTSLHVLSLITWLSLYKDSMYCG